MEKRIHQDRKRSSQVKKRKRVASNEAKAGGEAKLLLVDEHSGETLGVRKQGKGQLRVRKR